MRLKLPSAKPPARDLEDKDYWDLAHFEDGLVNHRLTWLLTGQPLLFLAYATLATAKLGKGEEFLSDSARQAALTWIPLAGIGMALAIWVAVVGVCIALYKLRQRRKEQTEAGVSDLTTILGMIPPVLIPLVLAFVWWKIYLSNP